MEPRNKRKTIIKSLGFTLSLLYLVGALSFLTDYTSLFLPLSPYLLIFTAVCLLYSIRGFDEKHFYFLLISFLVGFGIEIVGVHTQFPFGNYSYGNNLGSKLFEVPLVIGVNWFILSYTCNVFSAFFSSTKFTRILIASSLMVFIDFWIEQVSEKLDFWSWEASTIPVQNYLAWFIMAFLLSIVFHKLKIKGRQRFPVLIYTLILMYFVFVNILV